MPELQKSSKAKTLRMETFLERGKQMRVDGRLPEVDLSRAVTDVRVHIQHGSIRMDFPDHLEYWLEIKFTVAELEELLAKSKELILAGTEVPEEWEDLEPEERNRIFERVRNEEHEDITNIIERACQLEGALYRSTNNPKDKEEFGKELFNLRKALEGLFGSDIPCNGY